MTRTAVCYLERSTFSFLAFFCGWVCACFFLMLPDRKFSNLVLLYEYYSSLLCLRVLYVFSENVVVAIYPRAPPHSIRMYNEGSSKIVKQTIYKRTKKQVWTIYIWVWCIYRCRKRKKKVETLQILWKNNLHDNIDLSEKVYCMNLISHFLEI